MHEEIESILKDRCGLVPDRPVVAGVSGGADSLCLMHVLHQAGYSVRVAHFDHRLRPGSGEEARAVAAAAGELGIPFALGSGDVRARADSSGLSIEEAARELRYRFLFDQARESGAQAVAVGHTADDQVETVLMHFLRGAGLAGLKGMTPRTILPLFDPALPIVRPLLQVRRAQTEAYCADRGLHPQHDPSNDSMDFLRNRVRHALIPELEKYNPKFREAALRGARALADDHSLLAEIVDAHWNAYVTGQADDRVTFSAAGLGSTPAALRRHLIRRALEKLRPGLESTYATLARAAAFVDDPSGPRQVELTGGLSLMRDGEDLHVAALGSDLPAEAWPQMPAGRDQTPVICPGRVQLAGGWAFSCETLPAAAGDRGQAGHNGDPFQARLDADRAAAPLSLRVRRPGDRFEPLGMEGHSQKLSDFFVNEKVPLRARERWPLFCAGKVVVWIPGHRPAHACRVTGETRNVLLVRMWKMDADGAED